MSQAFREYCELFDYFGRGGLTRLGRCAFERCAAEFDRLEQGRPHLAAEEVEQLVLLRDLLLRDRPKTTILQRELRLTLRRTSHAAPG